MDKLELIRTAHVIDQGLGALSGAVSAEGLKRRVAGLHAEWQELAYAVTAHLCGVEGGALERGSRRKASRRKAVALAENGQELQRRIQGGARDDAPLVTNENGDDNKERKEE